MGRPKAGPLWPLSVCLALLATRALVMAQHSDTTTPPEPEPEVHAFFYLWYGNPATDGKYLHWDHEILQHWNPAIATQWPSGRFEPLEGDVGATSMPARGLYSSNDPATLDAQMGEVRRAGIDVVVASWWPPGRPDGQGVDTDRCMPALLEAAARNGVRVAVHVEPYTGRTPLTVRDDIAYIIEQYGSHAGLYRRPKGGAMLPLFYIYDSYLSPAEEWAAVLAPTGPHTIRSGPLDAVMIGLFLESRDRAWMSRAGFDGFYTYFAATGTSFGSTPQYWSQIARHAEEDGMLFIPSVGPGYDDTRIRPWNGVNKRPRSDGEYFSSMWRAAQSASPLIISITSLNEWGEGTQIEPVVPFVTRKGEKLQDYGERGPDMYMQLTAQLAREYKLHMQARTTTHAQPPHQPPRAPAHDREEL